jgi:hypothetical protein
MLGSACGCIAATLFLMVSAVIFVGSVFGDCAIEADCAQRNDAGQILWIAPPSALVIFFAMRCFVEKLKAGIR